MRTLVVVERAFRGTVEQQFAHVLWLVHALHRQSPLTLLLRGLAACYALAGEPAGPVRLAGRDWGTAPDYQASIGRLVSDGAPVLVAAASLDQLGFRDRALLPGVRVATADEIVTLAETCQRWWYL